MPDWYPTVRAARYLGVAVWELLEHPEWIDPALAAEGAEQDSRHDRESKNAPTW